MQYSPVLIQQHSLHETHDNSMGQCTGTHTHTNTHLNTHKDESTRDCTCYDPQVRNTTFDTGCVLTVAAPWMTVICLHHTSAGLLIGYKLLYANRQRPIRSVDISDIFGSGPTQITSNDRVACSLVSFLTARRAAGALKLLGRGVCMGGRTVKKSL